MSAIDVELPQLHSDWLRYDAPKEQVAAIQELLGRINPGMEHKDVNVLLQIAQILSNVAIVHQLEQIADLLASIKDYGIDIERKH